jgi:hypothetical protein
VLKFGSDAISMIGSGSWCADKSGLKEIELGAPVHLTFDELKLGDLSFHLTIGPRLRDRRVHRGLVVGDAGCERGNEAPLGFIDPRFELNLGLLSDHRLEAVNEGSGIRQHRNALFNRGDCDGFGLGQGSRFVVISLAIDLAVGIFCSC